MLGRPCSPAVPADYIVIASFNLDSHLPVLPISAQYQSPEPAGTNLNRCLLGWVIGELSCCRYRWLLVEGLEGEWKIGS